MHNTSFWHSPIQKKIYMFLQVVIIFSLLLTSIQPIQTVYAKNEDLAVNPKGFISNVKQKGGEIGKFQKVLLNISRLFQASSCQPDNNGDLVISQGEVCYLDSGSYTFHTMLVSGTLFLRGNITTNRGVEIIADNVLVEAGGIISADSMGYDSEGRPDGQKTSYLAGGTYGGIGGGADYREINIPTALLAYGSETSPVDLGSGGGTGGFGPQPGGKGGGAVKLLVNQTLTINGTLSANGETKTTGGAGGSGGSIWIDSQPSYALTLAGNGYVQANGGNGSAGGSGGRIAINYSSSSFIGNVQAYGGGGNNSQPIIYGGPGTIYWKPENKLVSDNNGVNAGAAVILPGIYHFDSIDLKNGGNLLVRGADSSLDLTQQTVIQGNGNLITEGNLLTLEDFNVTGYRLSAKRGLQGAKHVSLSNNGELDLYAGGSSAQDGVFVFDEINIATGTTLGLYSYDNGDSVYLSPDGGDYGITLIINQALTVDGRLSADATGYSYGLGPGAAGVNDIGGSYGGLGGTSNIYNSAPVYGSETHPVDLGSGGTAGSYGPGGKGGGAVKLLVNGTLTINGILSANGETRTTSGAGGSGGSVWIDSQPNNTLIMTGSGTIQSNGGDGSAGGGGGRIAIYSNSNTFTGVITAYGGNRGKQYAGQDGTIYQGNVDVDNSSVSIQPSVLVANSTNTGTISVTLVDNTPAHHPIPGKSINAMLSQGDTVTINGHTIQLNESVSLGITDDGGAVTGTIYATKIGDREITIRSGETPLATLNQKGTITFIGGQVSPEVSTVMINTNSQYNNLPAVSADGTQAPVVIVARDNNGNPLQGKLVRLSSDPEALITFKNNNNITNQDGQVFAFVSSTVRQNVSISAEIDDVPLLQPAHIIFRGADLIVSQATESQTNEGYSSTYATAGYPITYTIHVMNNGLMAATGVSVMGTLPSALSDISGEGCAIDGQTATCFIGSLLPAQEITFVITANISFSAKGNITSIFTATGDATTQSLEENSSDNTSSHVIFVKSASSVLRPEPKNVVLEAQQQGTGSLNARVYNDGLSNSGRVTFALPQHLSSWVTITPSTIASIPSHGSAEVTITANPGASIDYGQYQGIVAVNDEAGGTTEISLDVRVTHPRQSLSVVVKNDLNAPINGAVLRLVRNEAYIWKDDKNESRYYPVFTGTNSAEGMITFSGLEEGSYHYYLSADYHLSTDGTQTIDSTLAQPWSIVLNALPGFYIEPWQAMMSVIPGKQADQTLAVRNTGAAPVNGVQVQLLNVEGSTLPDWVSLALPNMPLNLTAGDRQTFSFSAQPDENVAPGTYPVKIRVTTADSTEPYDMTINIWVSSSRVRNVMFTVRDETRIDPTTQEPKVITTNGRIVLTRLRPETLIRDDNGETIQYQPQTSQPLGGNGQALFPNLEIGESYSYQMWADNYVYRDGTLTVQAPTNGTAATATGGKVANLSLTEGDAQEQDVTTEPAPFTYTWVVREGTTDLTYTIELTINNPDGSQVTGNPPFECLVENGCRWSSDGKAIFTGWYNIPTSIPRPTYQLAKLQLSQTMLVSWQMFTGSLWLKNDSGAPLDNMHISVRIIDETGASRLDDFIIQAVNQPKGISELEVGHSIALNEELSQDWQIIPKGNNQTTTKYMVAAHFEYDTNGVHRSYNTGWEGIKVDPAPKLDIKYEVPMSGVPCLEFDIATTLTNQGFGKARNVRFKSAQPQITGINIAGPITAQIIKTTVNAQVQPNSLEVTVGDIDSGLSAQIIWTIRVSKPIDRVNVTGMMTQDKSTQPAVTAVGSFEVKMKPGECKIMPVPYKSTRDGGDPCPSCYGETGGSVGGPISTRTGSADYSYLDLSLSTYAGTLEFKRWYSTAAIDAFQAPFGPGWAHSLEARLTLPDSDPGIASVKLSSTNEYQFYVEDGTFTAFPGFFDTLEKQVSSGTVTYQLKNCDQHVSTFDANGRLISALDPQGKGFIYEYDGAGRLQNVHDNHPDASQQRWIQLSYDPVSGKLQSVQDSASRQVHFEYDANGDLLYAYDILGQKWVYSYQDHRLLSVGVEVATASGAQVQLVERNEYDDQGRVAAQYNGNNEPIVQLDYDDNGLTTITDALGSASGHTYDALGTLVSQSDAGGSSTSKVFDPSTFRPSSVSDAAGQATQLGWTDNGARLTQIQDALGSVTRMDYDDSLNLKSYTDPLNHTTNYGYDGTLLTSITDAQGHVTTYTYTTAADAPQPVGLLRQETSPTGQVTTYHYDALGQMDWVQRDGQQTHYTYDSLGRQIKVVDPSGQVSRTCYDAAGRVIRSLSSPSEPLGDPCDFLAFQKRPEDLVSDSYYDALGNVIATVSPDGLLSRTYYDAAGRPIRQTSNLQDPAHPDASVAERLALQTPPAFDPAHPDWNLTSETRYDAAGNVIATIAVNGTITRTYYDPLGRVEYVVQHLVGQAIDVPTPPIGSPVSSVDLRNSEQNITSQTVYDANGNMIATLQLLPGCTVTPGVDANGKQTLALSSACAASRIYYDALNRSIVSIQNWKGADLLDSNPPQPVSSHPDENLRSETVYDKAGNAIATITVLPGCTVDRSAAAGVTTTGDCRVDRTYYDALGRPEFTVRHLVGKDILEDAYNAAGSLTLLSLARSAEQNLITQTVYDADGRSIASIEILPGCAVMRGSISGKPSYTTTADCRVSRTYYDAQGRAKTTVQNLTGQAVSETFTTPPAYDPTHPDQNLPGSQPAYDATGRSIATVDPLGRVTRSFFDARNRPAQSTRNLKDPANPTASLAALLALPTPPAYDGSDPARADWNITAETRYDDQGRAIASLDPLGHLTRTYYDALGRGYKTTRNLRDPGNPNATVEQLLALSQPPAFDPAHPDWNITTQTVYDASGQAIATITEARAGCLVARQADGTVTASAACAVSRTYYDALGRAYASVQHLTGQAITDPNLPSGTDANPDNDPSDTANLISYTIFNAAGQVIASIAPDPACAVQPSADGTLSLSASCTLNRTYYDGLGRSLTVVANLTGQSYLDPTPPARDSMIVDRNLRTDTVYDPAGNRVEVVDAQGNVTHFGYDDQGRLTDVYENYQPGVSPTRAINLHTRYTYDAQGNRLTIQSAQSFLDGTNAVTTFIYDGLGRLTGERDPLGHGPDYGYDRLGQRAWQRDAYGAETRYTYDSLGRLVGIDYPAPDADVAFTYGPTDLRKNMTDGVGTTTWSYDDLGRISMVTDPYDQTVQYGYDGVGNRTRLTYPDQKVVNYAYDGLDRLQTVTDWQQRVTRYVYDAQGKLKGTELPNGVQSSYAYDPLGRLSDISHQRGETLLAHYHYQYDPNGNRVRAEEDLRQPGSGSGGTPTGWTPPSQFSVEQQGVLAVSLGWPDSSLSQQGYRLERSTDGQHWQPTADLGAAAQYYVDEGLARHTRYWYRLTAFDGQGGEQVQTAQTSPTTSYASIAYPTGGEGELVRTVIDYTYDPLSRLTAADYDNGQFFHYAYDANGNRTAEITGAGRVESVYDIANRLTSVGGTAYTSDDNGNLTGDGTRSYAYDHAHRLVSVTQGTSTTTMVYNGLGDRIKENDTQFVLDLNAGLTQVLSDGSQTYLYGNSRIAQLAANDSAYFLGDALGSVRQLADSSGAVSLAKNYQPYGESLTSAGQATSPYGYTGEWTDNDLVYLRARFYSGTGHFLSKDTWQGDFTKPLSLNRRSYVLSNPINMTDPSGRTPCQYPYVDDGGKCHYSLSKTTKPSGIRFTPSYDPLWRGAIGIQYGAYQAQFINNTKNQWRSKVTNTYPKSTNLCGQISIAAILGSINPNITVFDVLDSYEAGVRSVLSDPQKTGTDDLQTFIRNSWEDYLSTPSYPGLSSNIDRLIQDPTVNRWYNFDGRQEAIKTMKFFLSRGSVFFAGVFVHKNNGTVGYNFSAPHWVVITGLSDFNYDEKDYWNPEEGEVHNKSITLQDYFSEENWIRIYNPFNNQTEYMSWSTFSKSWVTDDNTIFRVDRRPGSPLPPKRGC